ncbi:uncharacterized protein BDZ99DRAFT_219766 [Mytilinidion resinicola]|uniref:Uncharacterized protein n=1 Tax=Mytilinidion resinicola TaxID=574789 RepID=A0A6A6XZA4_9PEZI|nr:uncharacterized protein BDZ99DRAFT_219766 [Mytilinidion resinicola]KAF2801593.1 hypothetical protein BDZ99DRAFT_219766 [Mytilinidion resinicola]
MSQFKINPILARMLGTPTHLRNGRCDFDISEEADGTFSFSQTRAKLLQEHGTEWDRTFLTQPPCQSVSIFIAGKHVGLIQVATCDDDQDIRIGYVFQHITSIAPTLATQSASNIRAFLGKQPQQYNLPTQETTGEFIWESNMTREEWVENRASRVDKGHPESRRDPRRNPRRDPMYRDWTWKHRIVPPSKMQISIVLKKRAEARNDIRDDHLNDGRKIRSDSHFPSWAGYIPHRLPGSARLELSTQWDGGGTEPLLPKEILEGTGRNVWLGRANYTTNGQINNGHTQ